VRKKNLYRLFVDTMLMALLGIIVFPLLHMGSEHLSEVQISPLILATIIFVPISALVIGCLWLIAHLGNKAIPRMIVSSRTNLEAKTSINHQLPGPIP
jgi:hypothetical protein